MRNCRLSRLASYVCTLLLLTMCTVASAFSSTDALQQDVMSMNQLANSDDATSLKSQKIDVLYRSKVTPTAGAKYFQSYSDRDLDALYQLANVAEFYTQNSTYVRNMEALIQEFERRGQRRMSQYVDLYGSYVTNREFGKAQALRISHREIDFKAIPEVSGTQVDQQFAAFSVFDDGRTIKELRIDTAGSVVIVVSHPTCHFSQNARTYLDSVPELAGVFKKHSVWLVPPDRDMPTDLVAQWGKAHPDGKMLITYSRKSWPMLHDWETPVFYFMKQGVVLDTVIGWPKQGNAEAVRHGLKVIGLL